MKEARWPAEGINVEMLNVVVIVGLAGGERTLSETMVSCAGNADTKSSGRLKNFQQNVLLVANLMRCLFASMQLATNRDAWPHLGNLRRDGRKNTVLSANPLPQKRKRLTCAFTSSRRSACCDSMRSLLRNSNGLLRAKQKRSGEKLS